MMEVNEDENLAVQALGQLGNCCRTWTCEFCDLLFFTESEYNDHTHTHGEKENVVYPCSKCEETFKIKIALDAHELTHLTSEKLEYQCDVCFMWFQRLSSLKNHEKVHLPNTVKDMLSKNKQKRSPKRLQGKKNKKECKREPPSPAFELIANSAYSPKGASEEDNTTNYDSFFDETNENSYNYMDTNNSKEVYHTNTMYNGNTEPISVDDAKPHVCLFCAKKFAREKALISHMKLHDDNFEAVFLTCGKCETSFDDTISLQNHVATCLLVKAEPVNSDSDGSDDYFNPYIDEKPGTKKYINTSPTKRYTKDYAFDFDRSTLFRVSQGKFACDQCSKSFKTKQKLFRHVWIHRSKEHKCELCDSSFYTEGKLEDHMNSFHSKDAPYVCDECGKGYSTQKSLTDHKNYHSVKSREMSCPYCNKVFSSRQGFTIHQRIHTGERPYICEYCSKPFRDGATLRKHELIHTGERPFKCPICDSAFNQKVVLREHIRGVHVGKVKENICELCKEVKTDPESLSEHLVKHSDEIRGPMPPRKRNPFIIRWTGQEISDALPNRKSMIVVAKKGLAKKGRPKLTTIKASSDSLVKKKIHKNKKNIHSKSTKLLKKTSAVRKSLREKKINRKFSNYIQEDLDLLLELSKGEENNAPTPKTNRKNSTQAEAPKTAYSSKKHSSPVLKRKKNALPISKNSESSPSSNQSVVDKVEVKCSGTGVAKSNEVEYPPILSFTEVCAMCNEKFSSREDLLTHVTIHI